MHLMNSDKHRKTEEEADAILEEVDPEIYKETERDRKEYREGIDKINAKKRAKAENTAEVDDDVTAGAESSHGKGKKGKSKGSQIYKGAGELAVRQPTQPTADTVLTIQRLGLLVDCIDRSRRAILSAQNMFAKATEAFNERAQACSAVSSSLLDEYNSLGQARECVRDMQVTMQQANTR